MESGYAWGKMTGGLLNLAVLETDPKAAQTWCDRAEGILRSLWEHYSSRDFNEHSILLYGTRSKPHNMANHGLIQGDYYFMEALFRFRSINQVDDDGR
jgi:unsaturated chondroitin disaccharide hydrolase